MFNDKSHLIEDIKVDAEEKVKVNGKYLQSE